MLSPDVPVVAALSGGRDSVCLLDVALRITGRDSVLAVHVHHGLRGRDADEDAWAAAALARDLGAAVRIVRLRPPVTVGTGPSPVAWARDARRSALRSAADAWGGPSTPVLIGHTASDQAETVLLRAISSPGTRALAGMAARDPGRGVLRPLLEAGATREETGGWCAARGLVWRDDPTNPTTPRGRVRELLCGLEAVDPRASGALVRTADLLREDDEALCAAAVAVLDGTAGEGLPRDVLAGLPPAIGRRVLRRLAEDALGSACPRAGGRLAEVLALPATRGGRAALDLGDGARAVVAAGRVHCEPSPPRVPLRS